MYVLAWVILGAVAGWTTEKFLKRNLYGPEGDAVLGIAGALLAGFLIRFGGLPGRLEIVSTTLSVILGAVALTVLAALFHRSKHRS